MVRHPGEPRSVVAVPPPGGSAGGLPGLADFVGRRFAVRSPLVSWILFERLGGLLAYAGARLSVGPGAVTLLGGAVGAAGAVLLATAHTLTAAAAAGAVLLVSYVLDCVDGQLARATGRTSALGAWLDVTIDAVVIAFTAAALAVALPADGTAPGVAVLLAGAYGASRVASLHTAARVSSEDGGGMRLTGTSALLRQGYVALMDTPVVYVALCASRPVPVAFRTVILVVTVMTVVQTVVSARHHFASRPAP
jgi:phosphatidylglycerophosphate synthase